MKRKRIRRRIKWIYPEVQLRVVGSLFLVCAAVLTIYFELCILGVWTLRRMATETEMRLLDETSDLIQGQYLAVLVVSLALSVAVGIRQSFVFSGPLFRMRNYLRDVTNGNWSQRCHLRKGDALQGVKDDINDSVKAFCSFAGRQNELLRSARESLDETVHAELVEKIDAISKEFDRKAGVVDALAAELAEPSLETS